MVTSKAALTSTKCKWKGSRNHEFGGYAKLCRYPGVEKIASTYSCECNSHSKNELIQSILSTVNRREVFEERISRLSMEDIRF
nr:hypothetical protein [Paenibacillus larvae]